LANPECFRNQPGRDLLAAISEAHSSERQKFVENAQSDSFFETDVQIGSPIIMNLTALYKHSLSLTVVDALDLILQALEKHHADLSHPEFAATREGLMALWRSRIETADLRKLGHPEISVMMIQAKADRVSLLAAGGNGYTNILPVVERALICQKNETPVFGILQNFYWLEPESIEAHTVNLSVYGGIRYTCRNKNGSDRELTGEFKLAFSTLVKNGGADMTVDIKNPRLLLFDLH
jgi:hypothetical protein